MRTCLPLLGALLWFLLPQSGGTQTFDVVLPWDDGERTAIDLSWLHPRPAGGRGFIRATEDGHLADATGRVRFWGTNVTFGANFPEKSQAAGVARRLAKYGVNLVRFHHMDNQAASGSASGIWKTTSPDREIDPGQLDRLDYFVDQLRQHGIYVDLNLLVSRPFNRGTDLPADIDRITDWKVRGALGFFDPQTRELQKRFATDLLTHVNPYTGRAYVEEPSVAFIEINNENGLAQAFLSADLDDLPPHYAGLLKEAWNGWLRNRHGDHDALAEAWGVQQGESGAEMLRNGSFDRSLSPWNGEQHETARASFASTTEGESGGPAARIAISATGAAGWHVQFNQGGLALERQVPYTLTFSARASASRTISVDAGMAQAPWSGLGFSASLPLTNAWRTFTFTFAVNQSFANARINFSNMGLATGTVWIAGVSLRAGGQLGLSPEERLDAGGIGPFRQKGETVARTAQARRDWFRFLMDTEERAWSEMRDHLRSLGARPLIVGTVIGCSTPNLMARFDAVDTHAYWTHPAFPGTPWDPADWYVENAAMVNAPARATVTGLALRRVLGKPHMVTEYNHAAPNTFQAEAFPLLAAYGALQDFDVLLPFDYSSDRSWDAGRAKGYFAIDQNPLKMASFLPSALAFLRGDISPARELVTVRIGPADEVDQLLRSAAWRLVDAQTAGVNPLEALRHRVAIAVEGTQEPDGARRPGQTDVSGAVAVSDTGEVRWDTSIPGRGVVSVDGRGSKMVVGFGGGRRFDLEGVIIEPGQTLQQGFGVIAVSALDSPSVQTAGRLLVTAVGTGQNTGAVWYTYPSTPLAFPPAEGLRITHRRDWGTRPFVAEGIASTITLPVSPAGVTVWALDETGARRTPVPVRNAAERAQFDLSGEYRAFWYEVELPGAGAARAKAGR
jgi:hypothetical protein